MDNKETIICFVDSLEEFDEYKLLPRRQVIRLLNKKIKKDPMVIAFADSSMENGKRFFPEYRVNKSTNKLYLWIAPSMKEHSLYECEAICEYIESKYATFTEK